jgi:hypothetical protein
MYVRDLLDWGTAGALVVLVLLDSLRKIPVGTLVLRKFVGQPWTVVPPPGSWRSVLSWPAPFAMTALVHQTRDATASAGLAESKLDHRDLRLLRVLGGVTLLSLVLGVPLASRWLAAAGFLLSLAGVLLLSTCTAVTAVLTTPPASDGQRRVPWWAFSIVSPFGAPRACDIYLERLLRNSSQIDVARRFLSPDEFVAWLRPRAYDRLESDSEADPELDERFERSQLLAMVEAAPAGSDGAQPFCPRCGTAFQVHAFHCNDCDVQLVGGLGS